MLYSGFYLSHQVDLTKVPNHYLIAVMGDMNAKVDAGNTHNDRIMGQHGCGDVKWFGYWWYFVPSP